MSLSKIILIATIAFFIFQCRSTKKTTTSVTSPTPVTASTTTTVTSGLLARSADGIYPPGNAELSAIQVHYTNVTLEKLKEGYSLYTQGACVDCHKAQSIYKYPEGQWAGIIDDMAKRANITDAQKDAVYKYVLAIKATQSK